MIYRIELKPWPEAFGPPPAFPWRLLRDGVQIGIYETADDAISALPEGADYEIAEGEPE